MKYLFLAVVLFIAGIALTRIERQHQSFTPVVRVRTTNGLFMTFVQPETNRKSACTEGIDLIVTEFAKQCVTCSVESTECALTLQGVDGALARKERVPLYVVASDELRIGILGPPESVRARCEGIANHMVHDGVASATCVPPATPS